LYGAGCFSPSSRPSTPCLRPMSPSSSDLHLPCFPSPSSPEVTSGRSQVALQVSAGSPCGIMTDSPTDTSLHEGAAATAACPLCQPGAAQVLLCPPAAINFQFALLARPSRDHNGRVTAEYFRHEGADAALVNTVFWSMLR
jgi:hypothetical protein